MIIRTIRKLHCYTTRHCFHYRQALYIIPPEVKMASIADVITVSPLGQLRSLVGQTLLIGYTALG